MLLDKQYDIIILLYMSHECFYFSISFSIAEYAVFIMHIYLSPYTVSYNQETMLLTTGGDL